MSKHILLHICKRACALFFFVVAVAAAAGAGVVVAAVFCRCFVAPVHALTTPESHVQVASSKDTTKSSVYTKVVTKDSHKRKCMFCRPVQSYILPRLISRAR